MSFDVPPTPPGSSEPPKDAVDAQVEGICRSDFFDAPLRPHLLRFLVRKKFEGFFKKRPQPGRKDLRDDFYRWASKELSLGPPGDIEGAGKKLLNDLTHALDNYYRGPGCDDDIVITIPGGKGTLPEPQITSKALSLSSDSIPVIHSPAEPVRGSIYKKLMGLPIHLYHLTRDANGRPVWYYNSLEVARNQDGTLTANTRLHQASSGLPAMAPYTYKFTLAEDRGHLIVSGRNSDQSPDITVQVFPNFRPGYSPWCGASIITRTLHQDSAASVCILSDHRLEGVENAQDGEAISDPVKMRSLRTIWKEGANRIGLNRISQTGEILPVGKWDISTILKFLKEYAERSSSGASGDVPRGIDHREVRIWVTRFHDAFDMETVFADLVKGGVKVKILMTNPDNDALVRGKYRLREAEEFEAVGRATADIREQLAQFNKLAAKLTKFSGSLEVQLCDSTPFGVYFQIGNDVMLLGYSLPSKSFKVGPLLIFYPWSDQWDIFEENWALCWENPLDSKATSGKKKGMR